MKLLFILFLTYAFAKDLPKSAEEAYNRIDWSLFKLGNLNRESNDSDQIQIRKSAGRGRIYLGGFVTPDIQSKYKYQVRLMSNNAHRNGETMACGGSLINKNYVLTAAHCLKDVHSEYVEVKDIRGTIIEKRKKEFEADYSQMYFGITNLDKLSLKEEATTSRISYASDFSIHSKWDPKLPQTIYDIALIKLNQEVIPNEQSKFGYISLPSTQFCQMELQKKIVTISGWGRTDQTGRTKILKAADIVVRKNDYCKKNFKDFDANNMICANTMEGAGTCSGDSGGPMSYNVPDTNEQILVGITSYGSHDCTDGKPSVFTSVCAYSDWINEII